MERKMEWRVKNGREMQWDEFNGKWAENGEFELAYVNGGLGNG
jgi:hypothetical protein